MADYDFRESKPKKKKKPNDNRRGKRKDKKLLSQQEKIRQRTLSNTKEHLEKSEKSTPQLTRDDVKIQADSTHQTAYIAEKKWKQILLLNKKTDTFMAALLHEDIPKVLRGDFVVGDQISYIRKKNETLCITKRENRNNYLARTRADSTRYGGWEEQIIAANIDIAVIVMPIKKPSFEQWLVDRYLVLCQNWGVEPILCVNKVDLSDKRDPIILQYKNEGIPVVETSPLLGIGIEGLKKLLKNKTSILVGKSWAGKSSLVNSIHPEIKTIVVQEVNAKSGEGKHTTTASSLYQWDANSYLVDTPGVRALGMDQIGKKELVRYFPEFSVYRWQCKYSKCLHQGEDGCAIAQAAREKKINQRRYKSYLRILEDLV